MIRTTTSRGRLGGALILGALSLSACATEDYVNKQVAGIQAQVMEQGGRVGSLEGKAAEQDAHLAKLDTDMQATMTLANGKFNYDKIAEETVLFKTGSATLSPVERTKLNDLATRLRSENVNAYLQVVGYADAQGGKQSNHGLGLSRARTVYDYMCDQGVALNRMALMSHGEDHPAQSNTTSAGRAQNRRVLISIME